MQDIPALYPGDYGLIAPKPWAELNSSSLKLWVLDTVSDNRGVNTIYFLRAFFFFYISSFLLLFHNHVLLGIDFFLTLFIALSSFGVLDDQISNSNV